MDRLIKYLWISYLKTKTRKRIDEILMSVNGTLSEHQKSFLKILMCHYDSMKEHLIEIETHLQEDMLPFALQIEQLNTIYGINYNCFLQSLPKSVQI